MGSGPCTVDVSNVRSARPQSRARTETADGAVARAGLATPGRKPYSAPFATNTVPSTTARPCRKVASGASMVARVLQVGAPQPAAGNIEILPVVPAYTTPPATTGGPINEFRSSGTRQSS